MFREASNNNLDEYTDSVTGFIRKCIEDVLPTKPVHGYPNQKPWRNCEVRAALNARAAAFKSGHTKEYKKASYALRKTIQAAKRGKLDLWITSVLLPDELNTFYARFEVNQTVLPERAPITTDSAPHSVSVADVCKAFKCVNIRKAPGPDGIPGRILKVFAHQLAGVFTDIFNCSLSLSVEPACFKLATIVPVPKTARITTLNDWRPVALTSIISKCFEKLVRDFICSSLPATLDPMQFAYRQNRSTDDAIALTLHTALSHLDKKNTYVRMLFVDYSSAFNTIVPSRLEIKLRHLDLNSSLCWLRRFGMSPRILRTFCTCTVESILTGSITTWYGSCTAIERKALQRVVQTAQCITGVQLPNLLDLYTSRCLRKTKRIPKGLHPPKPLSVLTAAEWEEVPKYKVQNQPPPRWFLPPSHQATEQPVVLMH
ncbi:hypothetical protein NFI96_032437, partial [Prochilodus magdalenae]